jgi:hypothetical protein
VTDKEAPAAAVAAALLPLPLSPHAAGVRRVSVGEAALDFRAVVASMRAHAAHTHVQQAGCDALARLSERDFERQVDAAKAGAIEAVVTALITHSTHAGVSSAGCSALWSMTENTNNRLAAVTLGAIEAVVAALRLHARDTDVQEQGYRALHCLVTEQGLSWRDIADSIGNGVHALSKAEAQARERAVDGAVRACMLLAGLVLASASAATDGWARVQSTCSRAFDAPLSVAAS